MNVRCWRKAAVPIPPPSAPQEVVGCDQPLQRLPSVAAAGGDGLAGGRVQVDGRWRRGFTTQPISREFDEAGVKRDWRWSEELREREHVRNRPTQLLRPVRLRRIAHGDEECRDLIIAEAKLT